MALELVKVLVRAVWFSQGVYLLRFCHGTVGCHINKRAVNWASSDLESYSAAERRSANLFLSF